MAKHVHDMSPAAPDARNLDPVRACLAPAFEAGELCNQFVWHTEQAVYLHSAEELQHREAVGKEFAEKLTEVVPDRESGLRLMRGVADSLSWVRSLLDSEPYADDWCGAVDLLRAAAAANELRNFAQKQFEETFAALCSRVDTHLWRVQEHIKEGLKPYPVLDRAFRLGEAIDQGARPPGGWQKGFRRQRNAVSGQHQQGDVTASVDPRTFTASRDHGPPDYALTIVPIAPGELPPGDAWYPTVRSRWADLGLPPTLPRPTKDELTEGTARRPAVLAQVREAAREGIAQLVGAPPRCLATGTAGALAAPASGNNEGARASASGEQPVQCDVKSGAGVAPPPPISAEEIDRLRKIKKRIDPKGDYVGDSYALLRVFEKIDRFNKSPDKPVLILGPTGAGKTEIARLIHQDSNRKGKPFARTQAAEIMGADPLIARSKWAGVGKQSGLQDMKEGSRGLLKDSEGGTIFLDELGHLSVDFQTFLLDVLDRKEIRPAAGEGGPFLPNVRLIFATNVDPEAAVQSRTLKHDLWSRLQQWVLEIPALCDRREDIFLFVERECGNYKPSPAFLLCLLKHSWPGNVRELREVLEVAVNKTARKHESLTPDHLHLSDPTIVQGVRGMTGQEIEAAVMCELAASLVRQGLKKGKGLNQRMAEILKMSEPTVSRRMKKYHLTSR
jgi:DNA-binding NtrC family response regulator